MRAADQDQLAAEVDEDEDLGARAVPRRIRLELREVDDGEFRAVRGALARIVFRQKHVAGKKIVPGELVHDADRYPVLRVGAAPGVEDEQVLVLGVGHHVAVQEVELRLLDRLVYRAPVDVLLALRLPNDELVIGRAARVLSGPGDERPFGGHLALATAQGLLIERRGAQVPVDVAGADNSQSLEPVRPLNLYRHLYFDSPKSADRTVY